MRAFQQRWHGRVDFRATEAAGHATALARQAVEEGYQTIAAAGGDGTVHEVANGILATGSDDVTFAIVPIGSANDYAYSLQQQFGISSLDDASHVAVDVGKIASSDGRERFFVEALGIGLTGEITAESRKIPDRQGLWLYGTAALRVLRQKRRPLSLQLTWDDDPPIAVPTRLLSVLLGQREGKFRMAKDAKLDDGQFDIVHGGNIGHWSALRLFPRFLLSGPPSDHPLMTLRRCRRLKVKSPEPLAIHTDGEVFATPDDGVVAIEVVVLPLRLRVKVCGL